MVDKRLKPLQPPAQIGVYVDVLGLEGAVDFLLTFGGAELYLPAKPRRSSQLVQAIGLEKARALVARSDKMQARVPLAKPWIAAHLKSKGLSNADIARKLHVTDVTVRSYLASFEAANSKPSGPDRQVQLRLPL